MECPRAVHIEYERREWMRRIHTAAAEEKKWVAQINKRERARKREIWIIAFSLSFPPSAALFSSDRSHCRPRIFRGAGWDIMRGKIIGPAIIVIASGCGREREKAVFKKQRTRQWKGERSVWEKRSFSAKSDSEVCDWRLRSSADLRKFSPTV